MEKRQEITSARPKSKLANTDLATRDVVQGADVQAALRTLVHEVRSPLQSMLSSLDVLDAAELPAGPRRAVERLQRCALALEAHLGDLATLLLIQSADSEGLGDLGTRSDVFEVRGLLREVEALAVRMGFNLKLERSGAPMMVVADAHLLRSMLLRLGHAFSKLPDANAITISVQEGPPGSSSLRVELRSSEFVAWPTGFDERLSPVRVMAGAVGGHLDLADGVAILTIPAFINNGRSRPLASSRRPQP